LLAIIALLLLKKQMEKGGCEMHFERTVSVIDSHTAGEAARLVISGVPKLRGKTVAEKKQYMHDNQDQLRCALMHEPRGHDNMFGAILVEPEDERADFGIIFMDSQGYLNMCGHNTIAAVTIAIETGMVTLENPNLAEKKVILDTPAGLVPAIAEVKNQKVQSVAFQNVASFLYLRDQTLMVPGLGELTVDIAFGGSFFLLVSAKQMPFTIQASEIQNITNWGLLLRKLVNQTIAVQHPTLAHIQRVDLVEFYEEKLSGEVVQVKNVVVFGDGQIDRSPCGTGTSAKIATLAAKGQLALGQKVVNESILGTKFTGRFVKHVQVSAGQAGVIPEIRGRAFITGFNRFIMDPEDPLKNGFELK
jgi:proline racemase